MKKNLLKLSVALLVLPLTVQNIQAQNGVRFDGTDDRISTTYQGPIGNGARTIEAWVKRNNTSTSQQIIAEHGGGADDGFRFTLKIQNNHVRFESGGTLNYVEGVTNVNSTGWNHVAVVYDPTATPNTKLYLNGVLDKGADTPLVNTSAIAPLNIGARSNGVGPFPGVIDEFRFWDKALTLAEIQSNMNVEFCTTNPNLKAYYKLNQGTAGGTNTGITSVTDSSGNSYTGTLNNSALTGATSNWVAGKPLALNDAVTNASNVLTATQTGATYQWVNCNNANAPISGATNQSYTPTANGSFAVIVSKNGCSVTSACQMVDLLKTDEASLGATTKLYSNPTKDGLVNVALNKTHKQVEATLYSVEGRLLQSKKHSNVQSFVLNIQDQPKGVYLLQLIVDSGEKTTFKVIKN